MYRDSAVLQHDPFRLIDRARLSTHFKECPVGVGEGAQTPVLLHVLVATQGACHTQVSDAYVEGFNAIARASTQTRSSMVTAFEASYPWAARVDLYPSR